MNNFTNIFEDVRKNFDSEVLLSSEITRYLNKVNKIIPVVVKDAIHLTQKYNLLSKESIEEIKNSSKGKLKSLSKKYNIPEDKIEDVWKILKELKNNIRLLPQYQSSWERELVELGKLAKDDLTIDLETPQGRKAAAMVYMPMVYKIVSQYVGKSKLSRAELISAGTLGLTSAMNEWDKEKNQKRVPFKTYASYRIQQQILNDINEFGHSLSGFNDYALKKGYNADALSLDGMLGLDDDGDFNQDRIAALGTVDKSGEKEDQWEPIYKLIENRFQERDVNIFYRFFGMNGYKKEKSKDLAKEFGWSEGNIRNSVINKILNFLRKDKRAMELLAQIQDTYNESIMLDLWQMEKDEIIETLLNDDIFILLEELNRWANKNVFKSSLENSLLQFKKQEDIKYIESVLNGDFETLDSTFKPHKKIIITFLNHMYPTESMNRKTDVSLLEYMMEIQDAYKKHYK